MVKSYPERYILPNAPSGRMMDAAVAGVLEWLFPVSDGMDRKFRREGQAAKVGKIETRRRGERRGFRGEKWRMLNPKTEIEPQITQIDTDFEEVAQVII